MDAFLKFQESIQKILYHINLNVSHDSNLIFANSVLEIDELFLFFYYSVLKLTEMKPWQGTLNSGSYISMEHLHLFNNSS